MTQQSRDAVEVFRNDFATLHTHTAAHPNGATFEQTTFTPGTGLGIMVVPVTIHDDDILLGFVDVPRPATATTSSFEFPRGGSLDHSTDEARHILARETGIVSAALGRIETFHPENGMVNCAVTSFLALVAPDDAADADGHTDPVTGADFSWVEVEEFVDLLRIGRITDGMTLATWALLNARLDLHRDRRG